MYSMIMMMALTSAPEVPACHRRGGCQGCYGGYSGCYGGGCYGGGCYGGGWGGCSGGWGGCSGGWGGCSGRMSYSRYSAPGGYSYGNYYAPNTVVMPYRTGSPYQSGYYLPENTYYDSNTGRWYSTDRDRDADRDRSRDRDRDLDRERRDDFPSGANPPLSGVFGPAPATIIVHLPADARLKFDDTPTVSTYDRRVFTSPPLPPGKTFHYTLTAELQRDGKTINTSRTVEVRAGEDSEVYLEFPSPGVAGR
jgi:uncharacterized protein (TIGR03000 family)